MFLSLCFLALVVLNDVGVEMLFLKRWLGYECLWRDELLDVKVVVTLNTFKESMTSGATFPTKPPLIYIF